jgi:hypothetical protein
MAGQYQRAPQDDDEYQLNEVSAEESAPDTYEDEQEKLYKAAKKRVKELKDFYAHVSIFFIVNAFLFILDVMDGGVTWFYWPLLGWGIGVVIHAWSVFFEQGFWGKDWEERKIREYMGEKPKRQG